MTDKAPHILDVEHFSYDLPADRIAIHPLEKRDDARLLVFDALSGGITHRSFRDLAQILPPNSMLIANRSRVVAARLLMTKSTGGRAEVLLTDPQEPSSDPAVALASKESSTWQALLRGRHIMPGMILATPDGLISAEVLSRHGSEGTVRLQWSAEESLSTVLDRTGHVPLPPYLKRPDTKEDRTRYQTVFAKDEGSVAAPTAGLHFTDDTLRALADNNISRAEVTLHVGLGTFQPIEVSNARHHVMHRERIEIRREELQKIVDHLNTATPYITVVGTTSLRTIESLYWFGAQLLDSGGDPDHISCEQWSAFSDTDHCSRQESLQAVLDWMSGKGLDTAWGETRLMLAPGAHIAVADALVTNYHQPGNTLLMLVAAFAGDPAWKEVYREALENGYRFLSYGDSSLIMRTLPPTALTPAL